MATFHKRLTKLGKPPLLISFFVAIREYRYAYIKPVDYLPFVGFTVPNIEKHGFISSVDIYYIKKNEDGRWAINELCPLEKESLPKYRKFFEDDVEGLNKHLVSGYLLGTYGGPDSTLDGCDGQLMVFRGGFYRGIGYHNGTLDHGMDFDKCY